MGVALSCAFFGQRHCTGKNEADICRNEIKYLRRFLVSYACLLRNSISRMIFLM